MNNYKHYLVTTYPVSAVQHKPSTCPGNIKCCAFLRLPKESISKLSLVGSFINTYQPYSTKYLLMEISNNKYNIKLKVGISKCRECKKPSQDKEKRPA